MTAAYNLGGMMICPCRLNIRSVKVVLTPTAATVTTAGGALLRSTDGDSTTTEVTTTPEATEPMLEALTNVDASLEEPKVAVLREPSPLTTKNNNNIIANNDTPLPQHTEVAAMVHDQEWFVDDPAMKLPVNGNYHLRMRWRPPKLILMSGIFFDVVSTRTTSANTTINK